MKETVQSDSGESERCKRNQTVEGLGNVGASQVKGKAPPSIGLNVKTGARRNLGQEWTSPVIGNSVYGPASPLYYCLSRRSLFPYITIPELLVLPQHQLRADMLGGGRGRLYVLKLALLTLP